MRASALPPYRCRSSRPPKSGSFRVRGRAPPKCQFELSALTLSLHAFRRSMMSRTLEPTGLFVRRVESAGTNVSPAASLMAFATAPRSTASCCSPISASSVPSARFVCPRTARPACCGCESSPSSCNASSSSGTAAVAMVPAAPCGCCCPSG